MSSRSDVLGRFMEGFTAATELYGRTGQSGSFVEAIVLGAILVDGALRMGLVLKHQLDTRSTDVLEELLYQSGNDVPISERSIYKRALNAGVIGSELLNKLNRLYDQRNKVVHRYLISEITTEEVLDIAIDYKNILTDVGAKIGELEGAQIREGVGMVVRDNMKIELKDLIEFADQKHGGKEFASRLRSGKGPK